MVKKKKSEVETAHGDISEKRKTKHFIAKCQFLNLNHLPESFIQWRQKPGHIT